jgi:hypothetical protein
MELTLKQSDLQEQPKWRRRIHRPYINAIIYRMTEIYSDTHPEIAKNQRNLLRPGRVCPETGDAGRDEAKRSKSMEYFLFRFLQRSSCIMF